MPRPMQVLTRKILYPTKRPNSRITPKISIPRWWVKDTKFVTLNIYEDKIVIIREGGDEG